MKAKKTVLSVFGAGAIMKEGDWRNGLPGSLSLSRLPSLSVSERESVGGEVGKGFVKGEPAEMLQVAATSGEMGLDGRGEGGVDVLRDVGGGGGRLVLSPFPLELLGSVSAE